MSNFREFFNPNSVTDHARRNADTARAMQQNVTESMRSALKSSASYVRTMLDDWSKHMQEIVGPSSQNDKIRAQSEVSKKSIETTFNYAGEVAKIATQCIMSTLDNAVKHMQAVYGGTSIKEGKGKSYYAKASEQYANAVAKTFENFSTHTNPENGLENGAENGAKKEKNGKK